MASAGSFGLVAEDCKRSKEENRSALNQLEVVAVVEQHRSSSTLVALHQVCRELLVSVCSHKLGYHLRKLLLLARFHPLRR